MIPQMVDLSAKKKLGRLDLYCPVFTRMIGEIYGVVTLLHRVDVGLVFPLDKVFGTSSYTLKIKGQLQYSGHQKKVLHSGDIEQIEFPIQMNCEVTL